MRFLFSHLEKTLELRRVRRASPLAYLRNTAVVAADAAAVPAFARQYLDRVADLDYESNPHDGWALLDFGEALTRAARQKTVATGYKTFVDHVERIKSDGPRPVYLFGTGPSLQLARQRSFEDGTTIVCNTIVRDPDLWHHLAPAFLAAADAIYYFGPTPHARAFRADALQRLKESNGRTLFVYPACCDVIVRSEFREVEPVLVPVPWGEHTDMTVDLTKRFGLPHNANVLTLLLLPLGCTVSSDVRLWGFDGRAPSDIGFWANSERHSYPELMQSLRDSYPAFFPFWTPEGNEVKYANDVHGDLLDERLAEAERRGFRFEMLHRSWTPTFQKRYSG